MTLKKTINKEKKKFFLTVEVLMVPRLIGGKLVRL